MNLLLNKIKPVLTIAVLLMVCMVSTNSAAQTNFIKYKNYLIPISAFGSPTNVNVVTISQPVGGNIYRITWSAVSGAAYYQINITDENGDVTSATTTELEYTLSNLPLGTSDVVVLACNDQDVCGRGTAVGTYTVNERVRYAAADILGSPILEADQAGNVTAEFHYKPFGETQEEQREDIGYTGHLEDADLGLTYMQARYYDPVLGRFMSNDPVGFVGHLDGLQGAQGFSRYAYVNNNPYKYVDPDGRESSVARMLEIRAFESAGLEVPGPAGGLSVTGTLGYAVNAPGSSANVNIVTLTAGTNTDGTMSGKASIVGGSGSLYSAGASAGRLLSAGVVSTERFPSSEVINIDTPIGGVMIGLDDEGLTGLGIAGPSAGLSITAHGQETSFFSGNALEAGSSPGNLLPENGGECTAPTNECE